MMKPFSGPVFLCAALFALAALSGCKKKTTSSEEPPGAEEAPVTETAQAGDGQVRTDSGEVKTPGAASADDMLAMLPAEDRARYEAWFKKYGLSFNASVLDQDSDGDGYTNREEFLHDTNPRDKNSMPGVMEGVALKALNEVEVPVILREVKEKGGRASVQHLPDGPVEEIAEGSTVRGLPYKVTGVKYSLKTDKHGVLSDVSNVTLENPQTKETVVLIRDLPARSSETHAVLVAPDGTEQKVRVEDIVTLPGQGEKKFKVVDLRPDQVVVEDMDTREMLTIPKR